MTVFVERKMYTEGNTLTISPNETQDSLYLTIQDPDGDFDPICVWLDRAEAYKLSKLLQQAIEELKDK
jgi:hypothetical protein